MSEVIEVEPTKVSLSFEVKIGLPDYSNVVARAFVEQRVTDQVTEQAALSTAMVLAQEAVDGALVDFGGIAAVVPQVKAQRTVRGKTTELSVEDLAEKFGAEVMTEDEAEGYPQPEAAAPKQQGGALRVAGKQHGDLPEWLIKDAAKAGVEVVYDNRDKLSENAKRPWFVSADDERKPFWPPRGAKG
jgi:hypothetical protein